MSTASTSTPVEQTKTKLTRQGGASEAVYGLGMLGAWAYYLTHATTIWMGAWGLVKGIFWPAFLVYEWLNYLGM